MVMIEDNKASVKRSNISHNISPNIMLDEMLDQGRRGTCRLGGAKLQDFPKKVESLIMLFLVHEILDMFVI